MVLGHLCMIYGHFELTHGRPMGGDWVLGFPMNTTWPSLLQRFIKNHADEKSVIWFVAWAAVSIDRDHQVISLCFSRRLCLFIPVIRNVGD